MHIISNYCIVENFGEFGELTCNSPKFYPPILLDYIKSLSYAHDCNTIVYIIMCDHKMATGILKYV